jgi:hypothetical protein
MNNTPQPLAQPLAKNVSARNVTLRAGINVHVQDTAKFAQRYPKLNTTGLIVDLGDRANLKSSRRFIRVYFKSCVPDPITGRYTNGELLEMEPHELIVEVPWRVFVFQHVWDVIGYDPNTAELTIYNQKYNTVKVAESKTELVLD